MRSTFMGLETSKRGLFTQQSALYTVGNNISNANTPGYTRQRVNMEETLGFPGTGLNAPKTEGHIGTGVQVQSVQRVRDIFVDKQFRQESSKLGYYESRAEVISQMENVLNEPSDYGLSSTLDQFWQSLQDLSVNPENSGARAVVVQRGLAVVDTFNYMNDSLKQIQTNIGQELSVGVGEINTILEEIADLNRQIQEVEPNGYLPNDLYDARDILIDKLSAIVPIEVNYRKTGGNALPIADGIAQISLKLQSGAKVSLVQDKEFASIATNPTALLDTTTNTNLPVIGLTINAADGSTVTPGYADLIDSGELKSLMNSYGVDNGTAYGSGLLPDMFEKLDILANEFAVELNRVHNLGTDPNGVAGIDFFTINGAGATFTMQNISVNQVLLNNPNLVAASDSAPGNPEVGNGNNALNLANIQFKPLTTLSNATIQSYYESTIGELGVNGQHAQQLKSNSETLKAAVDEKRQSISSVSLDEEMTDMIRFQQAYNASARMITVVDETLDKIINGMGRVGL